MVKCKIGNVNNKIVTEKNKINFENYLNKSFRVFSKSFV